MKSFGFCILFSFPSLLGYCQQGSTSSLQDSTERFRQSIKEFESEIFGKRNVFSSNSEKDTIEISSDGMNLRMIMESRDRKDSSLVDFQGHYISAGLGQAVSARNQDGRRFKEAVKLETFGVTFFKAKSAVVAVKGLCEQLQFGVLRGLRISDFFDESERVVLPAKGNSQGVLCKHASGLKAEIWLNDEGRFEGVRVSVSPGDILENGERCPAGQWSKTDSMVEWTKESPPRLSLIKNSVEANGGIRGSRVYTVIESKAMEKQIGSLIDLVSLRLKNGESVSCNAQPENKFVFLDGRVVAVADDDSVRRAQLARSRSRGSGSFYFQAGLACLLVLAVSVFLWKRNNT